MKYKIQEEESNITGKTTSAAQDSFIYSDHELFKDEDNVPQKIISARIITLPKKSGHDWEILEDRKSVLLLKGIRFNNNEKKFLMSADGMKFLISGYKLGWTATSKFKDELKKFT